MTAKTLHLFFSKMILLGGLYLWLSYDFPSVGVKDLSGHVAVFF